jgi:hypothetical protein
MGVEATVAVPTSVLKVQEFCLYPFSLSYYLTRNKGDKSKMTISCQEKRTARCKRNAKSED